MDPPELVPQRREPSGNHRLMSGRYRLRAGRHRDPHKRLSSGSKAAGKRALRLPTDPSTRQHAPTDPPERISARTNRPTRTDLTRRQSATLQLVPKTVRLADLDPAHAADELLQLLYTRTRRNALRLGLVLKVDPIPAGRDPKAALSHALEKSDFHKAARSCVDYAVLAYGDPTDIARTIHQLRADLDGIEPGAARPYDLSTTAGVVLAAAEARITIAAGRTVDAVQVAILASVDERTIRSAVKARVLTSLTERRPMRFAAADIARFLYLRGVRGFEPQ